MVYRFGIRKTLRLLFNTRFMAVFIIAAVLATLVSVSIGDVNEGDMYEATTTVYSASYSSYLESLLGAYMAKEYVGVTNSYRIAERAAASVQDAVVASEVQDMVDASSKAASIVIRISAKSRDMEMAVSVANAVAESFVQEVSSINAVEGIRILDRAEYATISERTVTKVLRLRVAFVLAVLFVVVALKVAMAAMDKRVMEVREVTLDLNIPFMGAIPREKSKHGLARRR